MKKSSGLGLGLGSLMGKNNLKVTPEGKDSVFYIEVHKIRPNPNQPRRDFEPQALSDLASSIKRYGILQPILVSKMEEATDRGLNVQYEIIAGERRWRAAQQAGLSQVPVMIRENFEEERVKLELALIENIQREDLSALEEADAYAKLAADFGLTQQQIAEKVGKSREVIANTVRLLTLPDDIKAALAAGKISRTHARGLLAFKNDPARQRSMFQQILVGNFATNELEKTAKEERATQNPDKIAANSRFNDLQQNLAQSLGTAVIIRSGASGGSISIKFADLEQLNLIIKNILD